MASWTTGSGASTLLHRRRGKLRLAGLLLLTGIVGSSLSAMADTVTRTSAFEYDPVSGLLTKEIIEPGDPNLCLVTQYEYDAYGNKKKATTRNCNGSAGSSPDFNSEAAAPASGSDAIIVARTANTVYDTQGRFPITSSNALNHSETKEFDARFGVVKKLTGPNSLSTNWTYDSFGRPLTEARADNTSSQTAYALCDSSCPANGQYKVTSTQAGAPTTITYYDMFGRAIQSERQDKDGVMVVSRTEYDKLGRISRTSRPAKAAQALVWTTITYDAMNRAVTTTLPDSSKTQVTYNGLTTTTKNALNQTRVEVLNSQGQTMAVTDAAGKTLRYQYDAFGNLVKTVDSLGYDTLIAYDKRGRKIAMNDRDQGLWSYNYDALGQLKRQTDAESQVVTFAYDQLGRMTQRNELDLISTWTYDTCDTQWNGSDKCFGKPVKETADNGYTRTYVYDNYGRMTSEVDNVDTGYGVSKRFDEFGRVISLVYPNNFKIMNVYSTTGYLIEVRNGDINNPQLYWSADLTDAAGNVTQETFGNGVVTNRTYNPQTGRMEQVTAGASGSVSNQTFVYDSIGNLKQRYDGATGLNEAFAYDNLNRLTSTSAQAGSGPLTQVTLTYDAIGNIKSKSDVGTYSYGTVDAATGRTLRPHAVTSITMNDGTTNYANYYYDPNGNMVSGAGRTVSWKSWNMPASITGTLPGKSTPTGTSSSTFSIVYNSAHERVKETLPDGTVIYNISPRVDTGIHVEKRVKTVNNVTTVTYVNSLYAGSMPFGTVTNTTVGTAATTSATRYFHTDHLGSIIAITNQTGAVIERRSYDAWGKRRNSNGTAYTNAFVTPQERHGFTGHEEMDEVGLIHMNGRIYDPAIGRFMSADPTIQSPDDMQNYNRYSYIDNNPLSAVDYSGYGFFKSLFKGVAKLFSGIPIIKSVLKNPVLRTIASIGAAVYLPGSQAFISMGLTGTSGVITAGFVSGYIGSGNLKGALIGGITAGAFNKLHGMDFGIAKILAHGTVGGLSSVAQGGSFQSGFLAAGFTQAFSPTITGIDASNLGPNLYRTVAAAIVGGTASVIGGGKFENGAITGAFSRLFNDDYVSNGIKFQTYPDATSLQKTLNAPMLDSGANAGRIYLTGWVITPGALALGLESPNAILWSIRNAGVFIDVLDAISAVGGAVYDYQARRIDVDPPKINDAGSSYQVRKQEEFERNKLSIQKSKR